MRHIIEDLTGVLTKGLPANPTAADQAAFTAGTTYLRALFPGGGPGNTLPRDANQNLVLGKFDATVWTCDLSKEYVTINADYHT